MTMTREPKWRSLLFVSFGLVALLSSRASSSQEISDASPEWLRAPYLNTVLSIEDVPGMRAFYGEVLGLEALSDLTLPAREGRPMAVLMLRYKLGDSQIKMIHHPDLSRPPGGREAALGLRVLSIPVRDGDAVARRVEAAGGPKVSWRDANGYRVAFVRDPDDNEIELRRYSAGVAEADLVQLELALTVGDMEASRRHYGEWLGLPELAPVELPGFAGKTYRYRVGDSVLRLWSSGKALTPDTGFTLNGYGLRYVQFIVKDADALHQALLESGAAIAQKPTPLGTSTVLLFAADPDGVINECVGPGRREK